MAGLRSGRSAADGPKGREAARLVIALAIAGCGGAVQATNVASPSSRAVASNVTFADYAGSASCAKCHEAEAASFARSPMHNMTREGVVPVRGPFDGTVFRFHDDTATLTSDGAARFVTIASAKFGSGSWRLSRVIGGHHREDYVGIAVSAPRADAKPLSDPPEELVLPVSFVYTTRALRYKGYSVMVKERGGLRPGPVWNQTCIFCHNTVPFLDTVVGALAGGGPPYQGEVVDPILPVDRRAQWLVTDDGALGKTLRRELARIGAKHAEATPRGAVTAIRGNFRREHLVEVGIGCESCHLGSAEHVRDPKALPSFEPRSDGFAERYPARETPRAARINRACARCHQVLFTGYEHTWEGGARRANPGGSNINSGEARDLLLGACATKLTCVECHEPHASDATATLRALSAERQDALCTRCHEKYAGADALRAHAHHDPSGAGARCIGCHMPMKNMSLDGGLTRYHRIGSPTDPARVMLDRPLECAICHADASVEKLVTTMESWWKRAYDRDALVKLYGSMDANVLLATAERGRPHEQAVAFQLLGDAKTKAAAPVLASQLTHPYPIVRGYAKRALDAVAGAQVPIDIDADDAVIAAQAAAWLGSRDR
ncbi:MAG TPA: cytochrome c3 family protein [Labilithrix sp.]|jgi:predicted CXXCH cytochrome family protein